MSLTTKSLRRLQSKSFDKLYSSAVEKYTEMANAALEYVQRRASPGDKLLVGDVTEVLKGAVEINPAFEAHLKKAKLSPESWSLEFAEYIVEQVYPQPELKPAKLNTL